MSKVDGSDESEPHWLGSDTLRAAALQMPNRIGIVTREMIRQDTQGPEVKCHVETCNKFDEYGCNGKRYTNR